MLEIPNLVRLCFKTSNLELQIRELSDPEKPIERFHMMSRRPYWCPKTKKRRPCWCPKPDMWELNSFLMQTPSFVSINFHRWWPREWKHSTGNPLSTVSWSILTSLAAVSLYTDVVLFFSRSSQKHRRASARERARSARKKQDYPLALAVNKSPAVYILSPALDGLWRENRGSVYRLGSRKIREHWWRDLYRFWARVWFHPTHAKVEIALIGYQRKPS